MHITHFYLLLLILYVISVQVYYVLHSSFIRFACWFLNKKDVKNEGKYKKY